VSPQWIGKTDRFWYQWENSDGSGLTLLNSGDFDHRASVSESGRFFVDNFSRVNTVPAASLHDATGGKIQSAQETCALDNHSHRTIGPRAEPEEASGRPQRSSLR